MATKPDLAIYYHRSAFCPVHSTYITATNNGNFSLWPGITAELIAMHLTKSLTTAKCHAKLARKNVWSPRPQDPTPDLSVTSDPPPELDTRTKTIRITVVKPSDSLATDLTGRFPTISSRGYNYIIVCYIYDTNGIIVCPMKNRSVAEHIPVYKEIFSYLEKRGLHPAVQKWTMNVPKSSRTLLWMNKKINWNSCHPMISAPTQRRSASTPSSVILFLG